jgi:Tfp pilus assembly protein FimT
MAFQRSNQLKSSMRQMTADLRLARQQAIALRTQTRVRFQTGSRQYYVERLVTGTTWTDLGRGGTGTGARTLEQSCSLDTAVGLSTVTIGSRSYNTVVFRPDGTASLSSATATFAVRTAYSLSRTSYTVTVEAPGFVKAT